MAPAAPALNPTVARKRLAILLRAARERRGVTPTELRSFLGVSAPQASRLESGARGFTEDGDVVRLAEWYGVGDRERAELLELARVARERPWWHAADSESYGTLIGYEQAATAVSEFTAAIIPGLLQTADYARVAVSSWALDLDPEVIDEAVAVRLRRQEILTRTPRPTLKVVIDEAALARGPRDREVRRRQLEHLHARSKDHGVSIQILPFEYGLHVGVQKHMIFLEMGSLVPDLVYSESVLEPFVSDAEADVKRYRLMWEELRAAALDPALSRSRMTEYLDRL